MIAAGGKTRQEASHYCILHEFSDALQATRELDGGVDFPPYKEEYTPQPQKPRLYSRPMLHKIMSGLAWDEVPSSPEHAVPAIQPQLQ